MPEFTTYDKQAIDKIIRLVRDEILASELDIAYIKEQLGGHAARIAALESQEPPVQSFPGAPQPGTVYWGCSQDGGAEPTAHEQATGLTVGLRRVFVPKWIDRLWDTTKYLEEDDDAGRLTWISYKTPDWSEMAVGVHDDDIDELLILLDSFGRPVWVSFFHEPEDNTPAMGSPTDWRGMQTRIRARMNATGVTNLAFAAVHQASTHRVSQGRNPEEWWVDGIFDFLGVDHYAVNEGVPLVNPFQWEKCVEFADAKGVPLAVGEWGTHTPGEDGAQFIRDFFDYGVADETVIGFSCYDNKGGSRGPWNLEGEQLTEFRLIMADSRVAHV